MRISKDEIKVGSRVMIGAEHNKYVKGVVSKIRHRDNVAIVACEDGFKRHTPYDKMMLLDETDENASNKAVKITETEYADALSYVLTGKTLDGLDLGCSFFITAVFADIAGKVFGDKAIKYTTEDKFSEELMIACSPYELTDLINKHVQGVKMKPNEILPISMLCGIISVDIINILFKDR